ncbi:MAG: DUF2855 family protein [Bacteroidia bacterium]|nr:DUF2855 family protein [Bacteroidia bacterium]
MSRIISKALIVNKSNIRKTEIEESTIDGIGEDQILVSVDAFALTANNVTYAATGELLQYWNFFPTEKEGYGIVPVWGYATVVESNVEGIAADTRLYGYLPMAEYFVAEPGKLSPFGFRDMAAHRQQNAAIYNNYDFVSKEQSAHPGHPYIPIIRPLFMTSFLLYHFFKDQQFIGAQRILLTSASSKTAMALASILKTHRNVDSIRIAGMTSSRNKAFVQKSNLYDEVYTYDDVAIIPQETTIIADFAGNKKLLAQVDQNLGEQLLFISAIGLTDWEELGSKINLPKAKMFFAPTYAEIKMKEWGIQKGMQMIQKAMMEFIKTISPQIEIETFKGFDQMQQLYTSMVDGQIDPSKGFVVVPKA